VFLRAINVGRHNRIRMGDLRTLCDAAGLAAVTTYLQTGNLVFAADEPGEVVRDRIEHALAAAGLRNANAIVFDVEELRALIALDPFAAYDADTYRRLATLFRDPLPAAREERFAAAAGYEVVHVGERVLLTASLASERMPDANASSEKALRIPATTRYWHVVEAVAGLA
jgi:uncharacterized protein (DUF1697 family)